jgi:murein endopeptidase
VICSMIERWSSESFRTRCMRRSKLATRNHASRFLKQTLPSSMCTKKGLGSRASDCLDGRSAASKSGFRRRSLRRHPRRHWGQDCAQAHVPRRTNKFPKRALGAVSRRDELPQKTWLASLIVGSISGCAW